MAGCSLGDLLTRDYVEVGFDILILCVSSARSSPLSWIRSLRNMKKKATYANNNKVRAPSIKALLAESGKLKKIQKLAILSETKKSLQQEKHIITLSKGRRVNQCRLKENLGLPFFSLVNAL